MIETLYRVRCDRCERVFGKPRSYFRSIESAERNAKYEGWWIDGDTHLCPQCTKTIVMESPSRELKSSKVENEDLH